MTKKAQEIWHKGESQLHQSLGVTEKMQKIGPKVIREYMPDEHREFYQQLPFVVLSALDRQGRVWPILRAQAKGFIQSLTPTRLSIRSKPLVGEPTDLVFDNGSSISVLGIEFETKRRNRVNGSIVAAAADLIEVEVDQSYGNCPRYIHVREQESSVDTELVGQVQDHSELKSQDIALIEKSDMLFIASRAPVLNDKDRRAGIDVNHRGGEPGFVTVLDQHSLIIPDYQGNNFFNAYGNIVMDSRASVLFLDPATGDTLTLVGHAEVVLSDPSMLARFGSERYVKLSIDLVRRADAAFPIRYRKVSASENPPPRGSG